MRARTVDVIDVNRTWSVWVGTRKWGHRIGTVLGHDYRSARAAAGRAHPGARIGFIEEEAAA